VAALPSIKQFKEGILAGNRTLLARAITLVESKKKEHQLLANEVLNAVLPHSGKAVRIGISGTPGVGKSSFIESFGKMLVQNKHRVAVLAVDPSSQLTGGSILGDKTRMVELAAMEEAFVRPSPSEGGLGGVARKTRETMFLCEAAGYDVILVETVGIGQSESTVRDMVDFFLLLMQPGGGDELQGIKRGVLELADALAITKCDGSLEDSARQAYNEYKMGMHILRPGKEDEAWVPEVYLVSSHSGKGLGEVWECINRYTKKSHASGSLSEQRQKQNIAWMWNLIDERLMQGFLASAEVQGQLATLEEDVRNNKVSANYASEQLVNIFSQNNK